MKGLLFKDFLLIRRQGKTLLYLLVFYVIFFFVLARSSDKPADSGTVAGVVSTIAVMLEYVLILNTLAYDENSKWNRYALSLPVGRNGIVGAKYLFVLLFSAAMGALSLLAEAVLLRGRITGTDAAAVLGVSCLSPLVLCAVLLPVVYRFGLQKTRFVLAAVFLIPWLLSSALKNHAAAVPWEMILRFSPLAAALLFAGSYFLSCRLYAGREAE